MILVYCIKKRQTVNKCKSIMQIIYSLFQRILIPSYDNEIHGPHSHTHKRNNYICQTNDCDFKNENEDALEIAPVEPEIASTSNKTPEVVAEEDAEEDAEERCDMYSGNDETDDDIMDNNSEFCQSNDDENELKPVIEKLKKSGRASDEHTIDSQILSNSDDNLHKDVDNKELKIILKRVNIRNFDSNITSQDKVHEKVSSTNLISKS